MFRFLPSTLASVFALSVSFSAIAAEQTEETVPTPQPTRTTTDRPTAAPTRNFVEYRYRYRPASRYRNPVEIYRNGRYGRFFGDYYRDRNGGFFNGYDSRYRFGIHR